MLDKEYMRATVQTFWNTYAEYNKKLDNPYLPKTVTKIYEKLAQSAKENAEAWENVFFGYGYYTMHLENGDIAIVERG